jgi:hypothetical protein
MRQLENIFVEFGVENYKESNTRYLLMNNNWTGLVIDGDENDVRAKIRAKFNKLNGDKSFGLTTH